METNFSDRFWLCSLDIIFDASPKEKVEMKEEEILQKTSFDLYVYARYNLGAIGYEAGS